MQRNKHTLTAALFLLILAACVVLWICGAGTLEHWQLPGLRTPLYLWDTVSAGAESRVNDALDSSHLFIQTYGAVQRFLGQDVLEDVDSHYTVYRLSDGSLTFINDQPASMVEENAAIWTEFASDVEENGVKFLFLQAPQKIGSTAGAPTLPSGVRDFGNDYADAFLARMEESGTLYLDLRAVLAGENADWSDWFFRTDHHWKPEAALCCVNAAAETLRDCGMEPSLTAEERFTAQIKTQCFLGSQGKRCGSLYAGADDLTVLTPEFETDLCYTCQSRNMVREGDFTESVLFPERLEDRNYFTGNPYTLYAGGDYDLARIENRRNPDGPKVLLLRDSYGCAFAPFLALQCSELVTVDLRYYSGDVRQLIADEAPDAVLALYMPGALNSDTLFAGLKKK